MVYQAQTIGFLGKPIDFARHKNGKFALEAILFEESKPNRVCAYCGKPYLTACRVGKYCCKEHRKLGAKLEKENKRG